MTSQGSAITRLERALAQRTSATIIRSSALELPQPAPLPTALDVCLALLELEPGSYPRLATRWGARLAIERKLTLTDAQLTFAALAALPGPGARAGAEALIEIAERHRLDRVDDLLLAWLERRGLAM